MDLTQLRDEIENDPQAIGYKNSPASGDWKEDQAVADLLNDPANGAQITRKLVTPAELTASLDLTEFEALSAARRQYLAMLVTGVEVIDANEPAVLSALTSMFVQGSATRTALLAKIQRQGSRAEVLWGEGEVVLAGDVGRASNMIGA